MGLGLGLGLGMVCFRAKGWLGFMYYDPKLFEFNSLWRRILKEKQNRAETQSAAPLRATVFAFKTFLDHFFTIVNNNKPFSV